MSDKKSIEELKADLSSVIDRIKFSNADKDNFKFLSGVGHWDLANVQKFNFLVGANNSGKSRVLRYILSLNTNSWTIDSDIMSMQSILAQVDENVVQTLGLGFVKDQYALREAINQTKLNPPTVAFNGLGEAIYQNLQNKNTSGRPLMDEQYVFQKVISPLLTGNDASHLIATLKTEYATPVYIPTLRTLRHINEKDDFKARTHQDYFDANSKDRQEVFTGHSIANDLKRQLLGTHEQREKVRKFERFLSEKFFYGADVTITPRIDADVVWFKEGGKEEYPIFDLGDGIQAIIILTYKVFMAEHPTIFFIEEPEKYLHAGMQRTLIEALADIPHHMFFMTTHSNHFLDLALERDDVSTFQVSREDGKTVTRSSAVLNDLLDELGVRASSVLLANCSIWLEGVTDKLYLRAYMNKYLKELEKSGTDPERVDVLKSYHENLHYVFVEYQGSNITHWAFNHDESDTETTSAYLLNNKIFLLADGDIDWKGERTENLTAHLGDQFHQLKLKEIENYIPLKVMQETAKLRWKAMKKTKDCTFDVSTLTQKSYTHKTVGIGRALERCITEKPDDLDKSFFEEVGKSTTGTIRDKVTFCKEAVRYMNAHPDDWELTKELSELCNKLWRHIERSNQPNLK